MNKCIKFILVMIIPSLSLLLSSLGNGALDVNFSIALLHIESALLPYCGIHEPGQKK